MRASAEKTLKSNNKSLVGNSRKSSIDFQPSKPHVKAISKNPPPNKLC